MRPSRRLARSAIDATRFTPTSPHAYSRSSAILHSTASHAETPSSSFQTNVPPRPLNPQSCQSPSSSSPPPPTETPAQKVARLRAEHLRNRQPRLTTWEKTVLRGRVIADKAHYATAFFLIGLTVVSGVVTLFSLTDMILYNRRKREAFFAEQNLHLQAKLVEAKEALARGTVDDDQMLLINREKIAEEAEAKRRERKGPWELLKQGFSSQGLKVEEGSNARAGIEESSGQTEEGHDLQSLEEPSYLLQEQQPSQTRSVSKSVDEARRPGERNSESMGVVGGPLDQLPYGETATKAMETGETRSWLSWVTGR